MFMKPRVRSAFKCGGLSAGRAPLRSAAASAAQPPSVMVFSRSLQAALRSARRGLPLRLPREMREMWEVAEVAEVAGDAGDDGWTGGVHAGCGGHRCSRWDEQGRGCWERAERAGGGHRYLAAISLLSRCYLAAISLLSRCYLAYHPISSLIPRPPPISAPHISAPAISSPLPISAHVRISSSRAAGLLQSKARSKAAPASPIPEGPEAVRPVTTGRQ